MYEQARMLRIADGPDEVHKMSLARHELKRYRPIVKLQRHAYSRTTRSWHCGRSCAPMCSSMFSVARTLRW